MGHRCKEVPTKPMSLPSCYHITKRNAHTHRSLKKDNTHKMFFFQQNSEMEGAYGSKKNMFFTILEMPGIEPGAFHLQSKRATTALHPHVFLICTNQDTMLPKSWTNFLHALFSNITYLQYY